ncbi:MAG: S-layer homology domain-containing protein [Defluviitaleaceae bacterium]|nr:S-layer homology domain-containing protein [Defluviitaleaceae bacterium]
MKKILKRLTVTATVAIMAIAPVTAVHAANFHDVGANLSWAADAIATVSSLEIMLGDMAGNFNPNGTIDKFEGARIFARMSGFNPSALTAQQQAYYNQALSSHLALVNTFDNNFSTWNSARNMDIAYLLYRGVFFPSDLNNFINAGAIETRRIMSREEAAVFLVRFMGRTNEALQTFGVPLFNDHQQITPAARIYVYYLRSLGILNGGLDGNVLPRSPINRAAMSVLIVPVLHEIGSPLVGGGGSGQPSAPVVETVQGTITNTFPNFRAISVLSQNAAHNNRTFTVAPNAIITIGGVNNTFTALAANMTFTAILTDGEIVSINAMAATQQPPQQPQTPPASNIPPISEMRVLDGVIARISIPNNTVGIETRTINPRGEIVTEVRDYAVASGAEITRSGTTININNINVGDMVVARVHNNNAHQLVLEEREIQMTGTLVEKNFGANSLFPALVLEDANGNTRSFTSDANTAVFRGNLSNLAPRQLRIGDQISLTAEYGRATDVRATAVSRPHADVYIRDIFISARGQSFVVVTDNLEGSPDRTHLLVDGHVDPFDLTLGSRVRIWFDSQEIVGAQMLQGPSATNFTGHIHSLTSTQITVRDANFQNRTFTIDANTVFFNSVTGQTVNMHHLAAGMRVQIVSAVTQNNRAVSVTILLN